jgi:hypothetical protein
VSPPWFGNGPRLQNEANNVTRITTAESRAAGVSPPWLGKGTCQYASAKSRESVNGAITNPGAVAVANPRGAYAPRSCVGVRMSAGEIAIFAMHKRTSARAAVVSPPWYGNRTCNGDRFSWSDYVHHARSDGTPRLAHASRSWCATPVRREKRHSRCTNARFPRAATVSPPWFGDRSRL